MPRGIYPHSHRLIQPNLSPSKELAYVLGVIFSDGSVQKLSRRSGEWFISLGVNDHEFAQAFAVALKKIKLNSRVWYDKHRSRYLVVAYSKIFYTWYQNLDLEEIEGLIKDPELVCCFLKGVYDGDGSLTHSTKRFWQNRRYYEQPLTRISFHGTSLEKQQFVLKLLKQLGFRPILTNDVKNTGFVLGAIDHRVSLNRKDDIKRFVSKVGSNIPRKVNLFD